jgi:hypothetical protein
MTSEERILRAIAQALDDVGLAPGGDDIVARDFLEALKENGYIVVPEPEGAEHESVGG